MMHAREKILDFAHKEGGDLHIQLIALEKTEDGYTIERKGTGYIITGNNPRSCLYGVYHLKNGLGEGNFTTSFNIRGIYPCETLSRHSPDQIRTLIDRMGAWRFNTLVIYTDYGYGEHISLIEKECARRGIDIIYYYNTTFQFMQDLIPAKHFARDPAGRLWTETLLCETRPCFADPEAERIIDRSIDTFFKEKLPSHHTQLLFAPADGYKVCLCRHCRRLTPMEQWLPIQKSLSQGKSVYIPERQLISQVYIHRYRPPVELDSYKAVDRIFFDTHQRSRWQPLGREHESRVFHREDEVDWAARNTPLNIYFLDRIQEWRLKLNKPIVLFENLMVQGTFSCGQFNTSVLIKDLKILEQIGVDGILYECFEPGIKSFEDELSHLSLALWDRHYRYRPGKIEEWAIRHFSRSDVSVNVSTEVGALGTLIPAVLPSFPWEAAEEELETSHFKYLKRFSAFIQSLTPEDAASVIDHIYQHNERFDLRFIGFWVLRRLFREKGIRDLNDKERDFLSYEKLWDFMKAVSMPRETVDALILSIRKKL
ncbi:MAG: hypothetical protein AB1798_23550 [Spirochaetota bacterium]